MIARLHGEHSLAYGFGLDGGEDDMVGVHDDDGTRSPPFGDINQLSIFFGNFLNLAGW